jgi:hypothetical protein
MQVGMIDAIQSRANAAHDCLLKSKGDVTTGCEDKIVESVAFASGLGEKKTMIRKIPNISSHNEMKASTNGKALYPYEVHIVGENRRLCTKLL